MGIHIIIRKCWICHNNLLTSEQIKNNKPCNDCQKKDPNFKPVERQKKVINYTSYEDIKKKLKVKND